MGNCCDNEIENIKCQTNQEYIKIVLDYLDLFIKEQKNLKSQQENIETKSFTDYVLNVKYNLENF